MDESGAGEFARIATELHEQPDVEQTVDKVAEFAVKAVGADYASVMLVHGGKRVEIAAATNPIAEQADQLQMECGEGPCLAAVDGGDSFNVPDTLADPRFPQWGPRVAELGVRSVLAARLHATGSTIGALNLFAIRPETFNADDRAVAHVLARHASIALANARQEASLWQAVDARKLIGQAQGMLMERFDLNADQAFAVLRRYSQDNNVKLSLVARHLLETRRLPGTE